MIPQPIGDTRLIRQMDQMLMDLLVKLSDEQWQLQTVAKKWKVKDVVAHLLDGNIRTLSMLKDNYYGVQASGEGYQGLLDFLNELNAQWVQAMKRVSPSLLIELHRWSGPLYCDYLEQLEPDDKAMFAVAWAGEEESKNWMHIAREYTEKWLHQQQIRAAIGDSSLLEQPYFQACMNTFMLGMPPTLSRLQATVGTSIQITVSGSFTSIWYLVRKNAGWEFVSDRPIGLGSTIHLPATLAWKLFSKSIRPKDIDTQEIIIGDQELGLAVLGMVSVMA